MTIQYVDNPPFAINFRQYGKKVVELSVLQRVEKVVAQPFELTKFVFVAVVQSGRTTLGYSWISFKWIVLGHYGPLDDDRPPPHDLYLIVFKVVFWAMAILWCFTTTAFRLFLEQLDPPSKVFLTQFTGGEIDIEHLRTKELAIDVSAVPEDVTVDTLVTMFDVINFSQPNQPGYMAPSSRQEDTALYSVKELKEALSKYIANVKGRKAFLGTPPAYDTPRLMAFYQQIEDAIRFSMHAANQDLEKFQTACGKDLTEYSVEQMRQYKNLLENKARIALDMAIAGKHCGARYMGQTMSTYFSFKGETEIEGTLQDCLIELLAAKRNTIALEQCQKHFGSDTHALSKYMGTLGEPLGLPGTRNVIEHLQQSFDHRKYLKLFFEEYTVDAIIDAVQAKIKKSQLFREKIADWIKDQIGDWKKESSQAQEKKVEIRAIIDEKIEVPLSLESQKFEGLIGALREKKVAWPANDGWDDFVEEIFALNEAKAWFQTCLDPKKLHQEKNNIKTQYLEATLGKETAATLRKAIVSGEPLPHMGGKDTERQKIEKIRKILPIQDGTLTRVLQGELPLETALNNYYDLVTRRQEFFSALNLDTLATDGASPEILEWLLVSQNILLPQEVE
jgi:hypothetical protein